MPCGTVDRLTVGRNILTRSPDRQHESGTLLEGIALRPEMMQADGIHPNADAQPVMLDNVWQHLEPLIGAAAPAAAPAAP